jgi:hypothetical protein
MLDFFRAHEVDGARVPAYFIESTAPNNVDDRTPAQTPLPARLTEIPPDDAIGRIAQHLVGASHPNLVVMVHGFNNPQVAVLRLYAAASQAVEQDSAIKSGTGLVCVGYRWPSEMMGQPGPGSWDALPTLPTWLLYGGTAVVVLCAVIFFRAWYFATWGTGGWPFLASLAMHIVTLVGWTAAGLILMAVLLRVIVYFRDGFRAANYGVPDLIEIIRTLDGTIDKLPGSEGRRIQLSFIGHSMGGFVVTDTIRVLSDLFADRLTSLVPLEAATAAAADGSSAVGNIGRHFRLKRFVLVSPDVPAETLLSNRANFLRSALRRFEEAYVFSNEGDEVLRQISTLANYFAFPTMQRDHGFRLGNVEILSRQYGLIDVADVDILQTLRVGNRTLHDLDTILKTARFERSGRSSKESLPSGQRPLPTVFTYFDCTDYRDIGRHDEAERPLLTFAQCAKRDDPLAKMRWHAHLRLLAAYLLCQKPNVHGGYFEGALAQQLIYRLACLGWDETVAAFNGETELSKICAEKQIRVLISPQLRSRRSARFAVDAHARTNVPST